MQSDRNEPIAGVVLAAGTSSRFGSENKLLESHQGEPIVRHACETLLESAVDDVTVVVGYESARVREALDGLPISFVENPDYEAGQATSVGVGVRAVSDRATGAVFALGDMPFVDPASVNALIGAYNAGLGDALAPAYERARGNPVLFDRVHFDALVDVDGDVGGRSILLEGEGSVLVSVTDSGVLRDVDTPDDL